MLTKYNFVTVFDLLICYIKEGRIKLDKTRIQEPAIYHDPCNYGRKAHKLFGHGFFEEPRWILDRIPGLEFLELDRSRERSLCCEGGGGRMWTEDRAQEERLAEVRVKDAVDLGAEVLATACPFCLLTLEDAVKTTGNEEKIRVLDLIEIVEAAL